MKYFYLDTYYNKNENKSSIQIYSKSPKDDVMDDKGVYGFSRIDFPEISEIKYLLLDKNTDLTDILNAPMLTLTGILVNEKIRKVFSLFSLPPHRYYPAYVKDHNKKVYEYFWLQTSEERDLAIYLNYPKTFFYIQKDIIGLNKENIDIDSPEDIIEVNKSLNLNQGVKIKTAVLKKEFVNLNMDLFKLGRLSTDWIVSERLKEALESANITGISFKEASNLVVET